MTEGTILNFAEGEGLSLPSRCRVGKCEICAVKVVCLGLRALFDGVESDDPGFA